MYDYYAYNPYQYNLAKNWTEGITDFDFSPLKNHTKFWTDQNKGAALNLGLNVLGTFANNKEYKREVNANLKRRADDYTPVPYDRNSYRAYATDFYQSYQTGGETGQWYTPGYTEEVTEDLDFDSMVNEMFKDDSEPYPQSGGFQPANIYPTVELLKSMGLNPSSVDDGVHNEGSKHGRGLAVDLGINTTFGGDENKMKFFKDFFHSNPYLFPGVKLIDESVRPKNQKVWTAPHYHLEI